MKRIVQEEIVIPATLSGLAALHEALERFWRAADQALPAPPQAVWRLKVATAVSEIAANIVQHAYGGAEQGEIGLRLRLSSSGVEARFTDQGAAFRGTLHDPGPLDMIEQPIEELDPSELPEGGFGLILVRGLMDTVQYRRTRGGVNCWRLVKRFAQLPTNAGEEPVQRRREGEASGSATTT